MKTAYLILAHRNPQQLEKLIQGLSSDGSLFFVHLDARSDSESFAFLNRMPHVYCVDRLPIHWGGWNLVSATLLLLQKSHELNCDRFHLLSGQDYPLKSNEELSRFFCNEFNYVSYFRLPTESWNNGGIDRYRTFHFVDALSGWPSSMRNLAQQMFRLWGHAAPRTLPCGLTPFGGSQWWSITRECARFIFRFIEEHTEVISFFRKTLVPDELFFQTIIMNSPVKEKVVNDNLRYIQWDATSPSVLGLGNVTKLVASDKFFARKFDDCTDPNVLSAIEAHRRHM